ncbi:MAG TPA: helix-turn-helix transcriptional regulator [Mycobacteriales bacterium]|jgi:Predicted transcriptional regulators
MDGIGARVRAVRKAKGLTLEAVAGLAGISRSALWAYETGDRDLHRMNTIDALAEALSVSRAWLLGQPDSPDTAAGSAAYAHAERIRLALVRCELGTGTVEPRPLALCVEQADRAHDTHLAGDVIGAARIVPDVLTDLHTWATTGTEEEQLAASRAFVIACAAACSTAKWLGFLDLSWTAAVLGRQAAARTDDPVHVGLADFYASHALAPYADALANTLAAVGRLQPHVGDNLSAMQVYGMLHQMAAFGAAVVGRTDDVAAHLGEAEDLARRTGDRTDFGLFFGPTNLGIWRVSIAVEQGEGGRAAEIARKIDIRPMPSAGRHANFYMDLGRGFAQEHRDEQALNAFLTAERFSPERTARNPLVRSATEQIINRATRSAVSSPLRAFAHRMGALP